MPGESRFFARRAYFACPSCGRGIAHNEHPLETYTDPIHYLLAPLGIVAVLALVNEPVVKYGALALITIIWVFLSRMVEHKTKHWRRYVAHTPP